MRLYDYLEYRARTSPELEFAVDGERRLLYGEADAQANRIAHALAAAGLEPGDRFAVLSKNCLELALIYFAASKAGVVPVPLNYRLAPAEWAYILNDSGATLLVARGELAAAVDSVCQELPRVRRRVAGLKQAPALHPLEDLSLVGEAPVLRARGGRAPFYAEIAGNALFSLAAGQLFEGVELRLSPTLWESLWDGAYFVRVLERESGRCAGAWRLRKGAPVVIGSGKRYFGSVDAQHLLEDPVVVIQGNRVLHVRYRVRR